MHTVKYICIIASIERGLRWAVVEGDWPNMLCSFVSFIVFRNVASESASKQEEGDFLLLLNKLGTKFPNASTKKGSEPPPQGPEHRGSGNETCLSSSVKVLDLPFFNDTIFSA